MATYDFTSQNYSSHRAHAMVLALVTAILLSPLYVNHHHHRNDDYETRWSSGLVLPMVLAGLIVAIKTTSSCSGNISSSSSSSSLLGMQQRSSNSGWMLRIGSSSWGLAGVLVMLIFLLSCQHSVRHLFWR